MKKITSILFVSALSAMATESGQMNSIVTSPLADLVGALNVQYERQLSPNNSLLGRVIYSNIDQDDIKGTGTEINLGYRRYLSSEKSFSGWYSTVMAGYAAVDIESKYNSQKASAGGVALYGLGGYRWVADFGLVSELGLGAAYYTVKAESEDKSVTLNMTGVLPQIDLNFGFAF
jgi:hypothetical protein